MAAPRPILTYAEPGFPLPSVDGPFAVLIDTDSGWASDNVEALARTLLETGCRYFVFAGASSEEVHDNFDWEIEGLPEFYPELKGILTTYHQKEPLGDAGFFFLHLALQSMRSGLIITSNSKWWREVFASED